MVAASALSECPADILKAFTNKLAWRSLDETWVWCPGNCVVLQKRLVLTVELRVIVHSSELLYQAQTETQKRLKFVLYCFWITS